jgi:hypothetical protein
MKQNFFLFIFLIFSVFTIQAQQSISAKLIDSISQTPIPYATIEFNEKSGVISNEHGKFQIYINKSITSKDSLFIRCLGFETKRIAAQKFTDSIIILSPKSIELKEVMVSNKNYTIEEIIEKVKENIATNYDFEFTKSKLFYRESYFTNILKNDVKVIKSSIPEFNQKFIDSILFLMPKNTDDYTEILGNLYGKTGDDELQKLDIIKASHLYDKSKEITFEGFEEKFNTILKKYVKRDSYFKIKSGIFGTKEDIDSSFFDNPKAKQTEALLEQEKKKELEKKQNFLKFRKHTIAGLENHSFIFEDTKLNFLEKHSKYNFELLDYIFLNDEFVYKVKFTPKRSADFKGIIYINTDDFAIVRLDYHNVKALKKFNLFGLSFTHHLQKGTLIYSKNTSNKYALKYADIEQGSKFGVKRPLKIIEKNKHVKGRRKQNELSTKIHFIISNTTKKELVVFENESILEETYNAFKEKADVEATYLPKYDPEFWKGYNVIEPNQAIKNFKSIE